MKCQPQLWHERCIEAFRQHRSDFTPTRKGVAKMKSIKNLLSIAAFLVGTCQAVCIVDGAALLNSEGGPLKFELRFMPPSAPTKDSTNAPTQKQGSLPTHWATVTPIPDMPKDRSR
jgi:hypothetical protein